MTAPNLRLSELEHQLGGEPPVMFKLIREIRDVNVLAYFTIRGEPQSKARARWNATKGGKPYTPDGTRKAMEHIGWLFRKARGPHIPDGTSNFGVFAAFFSATNQRRDVDNMLKLVMDGLNKVAWVDDSQVTEVAGRMQRGVSPDEARTEVLIYYSLLQQTTPTQPCKRCGKPFPVYPSQSRQFCERACGYEWRKEQNRRACQHCGKGYQSRSKESKYCSKTCKYAAGNLTRTCLQCGKEYTRPQSLNRAGRPMCSTECRQAYWREHRSRSAVGVCQGCGGPTSKKTYKRCNACRVGLTVEVP